MSIAWAGTRRVLLRGGALAAIVAGFVLPATYQSGSSSPAASTPSASKPPAATQDDGVPDRPLLADYTLALGGLSRSYRVFVPADLSGPAPLLVALGGLSSRADPDLYMRWRAIAQRKHFLVLEPRGYGQSWNAGRCCGVAARLHIDDVDVITAMIASASHLHAVDRHRVYFAGFSNGGMMAYEYACRRPGDVAGIGVVAAAYLSHCRPSRPVPVMQIHGTADGVLPYDGGYSQFLHMPVPSAAESDAVFARLDEAAGVPVETVHLKGVDHAWPRPGWQGGYDTTQRLYDFLWRLRS
jgi:polyhydroxybutyrate depolymerase